MWWLAVRICTYLIFKLFKTRFCLATFWRIFLLILLTDCLSWSCWLFLLAYMWHFDCFFDECFDYFLSWCLWLILLSIKIIFDRFFKAVLNWRALGSECLRSWLLQVNDWNEGLWSLCLKIAHCTLFKMWTNLYW